MLEIEIDGKKERVIPRDYQLDVVTDVPMHIDFLRLKAGSSLKIDVPVHFINQETAPGIKRGGTLNIVRHTIEMRVPADNIPEAITIDLGKADINDSIHIDAVALPEGCKPTIARNFTIATIAPPTVREEAAAAAAAPAAAPAKGKK